MSGLLFRIRDLNPKWIIGTVLVLSIANLGWFLGEGMRRKMGLITADPYTYVRYAKNLAEGNYAVEGVIADLTKKYAPRPQTKREGVLGPIWNTSLTSDGRLVYTVAMGYPLWLSLLHRIGGIELCTYSNFFLWASLFIIVMLICREMFERKPIGTIIGATVCSLIPMFNYQTFAQMLYLWREPLFLNCLFGALLCLAVYQRTGRTRYLGIMAFCLGYAFSIKEANGIYAPAYGLALLLTPRFREKGVIARVAMMGAFFVLGCSPILIQNYLATGNALYSLQSARAFPDPMASQGGAGWRWANYPHTTKATWWLYAKLEGFRYLYLLPLLAGMVLAAKHRIGQVVLIMLGFHCALYLGWGNAEFRHMYFITVPTALFFTLGLVLPLHALIKRKSAAWALWAVALVPIVVIAMHPPKYPVNYKQKGAMTAGDAVELKDYLDDHIEEPALVLSHRFLRDILGTYTPYEVIRLSEMMELLDPEKTDIHALIDEVRAQGIRIYLIDNLDKDPKHTGRCDYLLRDMGLINWKHRLEEVVEIPVEKFAIEGLGRKQGTRLYEVLPWDVQSFDDAMPVPAGGPAFFQANLAGAQAVAEITLAGETVDASRYPFVPLHDRGVLPDQVQVTVKTPSGTLPPMDHRLQLVGWDERILLTFGDDVFPTDRYYFDADARDVTSEPWSWRRFHHPFTLKLPVRSSSDMFTLFGFKLRKFWIKTEMQREAPEGALREARIHGRGLDGTKLELLGEEGVYFLPIPASNAVEPVAELFELEILPPENFNLKLTGISSSPVWRRLNIPVTEKTQAVGIIGRTVPEGHSDWFWDWEMRVNGLVHKKGQTYMDIRDNLNTFSEIILFDAGATDCEVSFKGAGVLRPLTVAVDDAIQLAPGSATHPFLISGFYAGERSENGEHVVWAKGEAVAHVPSDPKYTKYTATVVARDGSPEFERELSITVGGVTQTLKLGFAQEETTWVFDGLKFDKRELAEMHFSIKPWQPSVVLGNNDTRSLGFQLFRLDWEPVEE